MSTCIGVIGAMDVEVDLLKADMEQADVVSVAGLDVWRGILSDVRVAVVRCGIGKVNAALCAQALVSGLGITHLINTGVAGSLDATVGIGDIVIATDCVQHDMDASALGYAPGAIPDQDTSIFACDPSLRAVAVRAAQGSADVGVHEGRIASGDQFVADAKAKDRIARTFGARCCEMEGAAIAQVAHANAIPCVVIRAISDSADGAANIDYPSFAATAAARSAAIVERMASELA